MRLHYLSKLKSMTYFLLCFCEGQFRAFVHTTPIHMSRLMSSWKAPVLMITSFKHSDTRSSIRVSWLIWWRDLRINHVSILLQITEGEKFIYWEVHIQTKQKYLNCEVQATFEFHLKFLEKLLSYAGQRIVTVNKIS